MQNVFFDFFPSCITIMCYVKSVTESQIDRKRKEFCTSFIDHVRFSREQLQQISDQLTLGLPKSCPPSCRGVHSQDLSPLTCSSENPALYSSPLIYMSLSSSSCSGSLPGQESFKWQMFKVSLNFSPKPLLTLFSIT
jgi:hypothetical protein